MADSTEDLRREFEEFEKNEVASDAAPVSRSEAPPVETPVAPAQRRMPGWIVWMVVADVIIAAIIVIAIVAV